MRWARIAITTAFLLTAAAAGLAGSRTGPTDGDTERVADPPDLTATAEIRRSFMAPGVVAIAVTNRGTAPVRVVGLEFVSDSFGSLGVQEFDATIPPSVNPRDLLTEYGAARCPDGVDSAATAASVLLDVVTEDDVAHRIALDLPHPNAVLDRLLAEACGAELIAASVNIELGELTRAEDGTVDGVLEITPRQGVTAAVTEIRGSVLFAIDAPELSGGSIPLRFDAHRCEGHAVGDAKQPFGFHVWVAIDGTAAVPAPIAVDEAGRRVLYSMLDERCGHAGN